MWKAIILAQEREGLYEKFHSHLCQEYEWERVQGRVPGQSHPKVVLNFVLRLKTLEEKGLFLVYLESYTILRGVRSTGRQKFEHWPYLGKGGGKTPPRDVSMHNSSVGALVVSPQQGDCIARYTQPVMSA